MHKAAIFYLFTGVLCCGGKEVVEQQESAYAGYQRANYDTELGVVEQYVALSLIHI